jgi:Uncharacterised nucleotidyltransferase
MDSGSTRPQRKIAQISSKRPQLISALEAISSGRTDLPLDQLDASAVAWAIQSGFGPLLYRAVYQNPQSSISSHWSSLKAADLTARIVMAEHFEAVGEIIDACGRSVPSLTLLKGISISEECYPEPHLRLMRDVDLLIEKESLSTVKTTLQQLGYRQRSEGAAHYRTHHHAEPFFHEEKQVWVEVHHALFSPHRRAASAWVFSPQNIAAQLRPSRFQGREVRRLSLELQIIYLAAHWAQDFARVGGMVALADTIYLLKHAGDELSWEWVLSAVYRSLPATYLYLLLSYLKRFDLVEIAPEIIRELSLSQRSFGNLGLKTIHNMIDRYFMAPTRFGPMLSERTVAIIWRTLILPGPIVPKLMLIPLNLSLPQYCRIQ